MPKISLHEMIDCAERELSFRKRLYPRWVVDRKMSREKAEHELLAMAAIVENLKNQEQKPLPGL